VISVGQHHVGPRFAHAADVDALDGALGSHRHEGGHFDVAARSVESAAARGGVGVDVMQLEAKHARSRRPSPQERAAAAAPQTFILRIERHAWSACRLC